MSLVIFSFFSDVVQKSETLSFGKTAVYYTTQS